MGEGVGVASVGCVDVCGGLINENTVLFHCPLSSLYPSWTLAGITTVGPNMRSVTEGGLTLSGSHNTVL